MKYKLKGKTMILYYNEGVTAAKRFKGYIDAVNVVLGLDKREGEIQISFNQKLDSDAAGYCWDNDDGDACVEIATHVQGEALDDITILQNIAHEFIHAEQIASGRMKDFGIQLASAGDCQVMVHAVEWEGETLTNLKYEDQPWEIEAYANEQRICDEASALLTLKEYEKFYG
jgi:hypothetical protein